MSGEYSVSAAIERRSRIKGIKGSLIALVHYNGEVPVKFVTGEIGKKGLKPDIWYGLDEDGKFKEVM